MYVNIRTNTSKELLNQRGLKYLERRKIMYSGGPEFEPLFG
jgi:hypothetical protein